MMFAYNGNSPHTTSPQRADIVCMIVCCPIGEVADIICHNICDSPSNIINVI